MNPGAVPTRPAKHSGQFGPLAVLLQRVTACAAGCEDLFAVSGIPSPRICGSRFRLAELASYISVRPVPQDLYVFIR